MKPLLKTEAILSRHTLGFDYHCRDLRTLSEQRIHHDPQGVVIERYPILSCVKLAVLIAFFESLSSVEELEVPLHIDPGQFRSGSGVLNLFDTALTMTPLQLAQVMMAASDGTATDLLIKRTGLEAVNGVLARHAPSTHLACDLGEMVSRFRRIPGALDCKQRRFSSTELQAFVEETVRLGGTTAADLSSLILGAVQTRFGDARDDHLMRCLTVRRTAPRAEMFAPPGSTFITKTGSLGNRFFTNDCGVIMDRERGEPRAVFAFCSLGWRLPCAVSDALQGLAGLEFLQVAGEVDGVGPDWTAEGEDLLMRAPAG